MSHDEGRPYFRTMKVAADGRPRCGSTGQCLGARPRDIRVDEHGRVAPNSGGMSMTPDTPEQMPVEYRPTWLRGLSRFPLFVIRAGQVGAKLQITPHSRTDHFLEPAHAIQLDDYQAALCTTGPAWKKEEKK